MTTEKCENPTKTVHTTTLCPDRLIQLACVRDIKHKNSESKLFKCI